MSRQAGQKGSLYIESLIAVSMLAIIGGMMTERLPKLIQDTEKLHQKSKLITMAEYVGNYIQRWSEFDPSISKAKLISDYDDGDELESERRINRLLWADPLTASVKNEYKTRITFWETASRSNSALINVIVWYDTDLDDIVDSNEASLTYSTVITEKRI